MQLLLLFVSKYCNHSHLCSKNPVFQNFVFLKQILRNSQQSTMLYHSQKNITTCGSVRKTVRAIPKLFASKKKS